MKPKSRPFAPVRSVLAIGLIAFLPAIGRGQPVPTVVLPKPDSAGWIKLFRGNNTSDFAIYQGNGAPSRNPMAFGPPFYVQGGDTIRTSGSPNAQLILKQNFSHYIVEVQMRWPGNLGNTGLMTKIQWGDTGQGDALPRGIECQGDPNQGPGQIWALGSIGGQSGGTWVTVHAKLVNHPFGGGVTAAQADSTQPEIDYGGVGAPSNNLIIGFPGWQKPHPAALDNHDWITYRVESHGKDTSRHFINGQKVMEYRNPRIAPRNNANQVIKYLTEGMFAVQSEGSQVWFRNWRIKLLPEDPLYKDLYPSSVLRMPRAARKGSEAYRFGFNGATLAILSDGRPVADVAGRRFEALIPSR